MSRALIVLAALAAALIVAGAAAGTAAGQPATANETANKSVSTHEGATGPHDLAELRRSGTTVSDAPASIRRYGSDGEFWVEYTPISLVQSGPKLLKPGTTVKSGTLRFRSSRGWDAEDETVEVVVVYWRRGAIERTTEDGQTVREPAAIDQVVERHEVELGSGYDVNTLDLREQHNGTVQATMWVEGSDGTIVDGARWRFERTSSDAARSIGISSRADAILWGMKWMFAPLLLVAGTLVWADRKILEIAGAGPGYGLFPYVAVATFASFVVTVFAWEETVEFLSRAPWALGVGGGIVIGLAITEMYGDRTFHDLMVRFDLEDVEVGEDGSGIMKAEVEEQRMVEADDGEIGPVERGLRQFYLRARGAMPTIDVGTTERSTQIEVKGDWRQMHLIEPTAEKALEYEPPSWSIDVVRWPEDAEGIHAWIPEVDLVPVGMALAGFFLSVSIVGAAIGPAYSTLGYALGVVVALLVLAQPVGGEASIAHAPAHFDSVVANLLKVAEGFEETADREYFRSRYYEQLGKNQAQRKIEQESSETSRMEAIMGELAPGDDDVDDADGPAPSEVSADD